MRNGTDMFWKIINLLGTIAIWVFIAVCIFKQRWEEGTFWVSMLILQRVNDLREKL